MAQQLPRPGQVPAVVAFGKIYPGYASRLIRACGRSKAACLWCFEYLVEFCRYGHDRSLSTREFQRRYCDPLSGALLRRGTAVDGRQAAFQPAGGEMPLLRCRECGPTLSPLVYPLNGVQQTGKGWGVLYELEPRFWAQERLSAREMAACCELKRRAGSSCVALVTVGELSHGLGLQPRATRMLISGLEDGGIVSHLGEDSETGRMQIDVLQGFKHWLAQTGQDGLELLNSHSAHGQVPDQHGGSHSLLNASTFLETVPPGASIRTTLDMKPDQIRTETGPKLEPEPKNPEKGPNPAFQSISPAIWKCFQRLVSALGATSIPPALRKSDGQLARELEQWRLAGLDDKLEQEATWVALKARLENLHVGLSKVPFKAVDVLQDERGTLVRRQQVRHASTANLAAGIERSSVKEREALEWEAMCQGVDNPSAFSCKNQQWEGKNAS